MLLLIALCEQSEEFNDLYFRGRTVQEYFTKCEAAKSLDRGLVVQWMSRTGLINPRRLIVAVQFRTVKFVGGQNDPLRSHGSIQFFLLRSISYLLSRFGQSLAPAGSLGTFVAIVCRAPQLSYASCVPSYWVARLSAAS